MTSLVHVKNQIMFEARPNITKTSEISNPTYYVEALGGEYSQFAFDEIRAEKFKGVWRSEAFGAPANIPMDLEIGTGNGFFFAHRAASQPQRLLLGLELKFKPLIQSIRRALKSGATNARIARYHAGFLHNLFEPEEIEHVFIHHPDPWTKRSQCKKRLMNRRFLEKLYHLQKPDSFLELKTDSSEYFFWAIEEFKLSPYKFERYTENLHLSEWAEENFVTHFEKVYLEKGQPIYYLRVHKP